MVQEITDLHEAIESTYSENQVFPYFELTDCSVALFKRVRLLAASRQSGHPWATMSDEELVRSAGLYKKDIITGKSGLTLAAALLLGRMKRSSARYPIIRPMLYCASNLLTGMMIVMIFEPTSSRASTG